MSKRFAADVNNVKKSTLILVFFFSPYIPLFNLFSIHFLAYVTNVASPPGTYCFAAYNKVSAAA